MTTTEALEILKTWGHQVSTATTDGRIYLRYPMYASDAADILRQHGAEAWEKYNPTSRTWWVKLTVGS